PITTVTPTKTITPVKKPSSPITPVVSKSSTTTYSSSLNEDLKKQLEEEKRQVSNLQIKVNDLKKKLEESHQQMREKDSQILLLKKQVEELQKSSNQNSKIQEEFNSLKSTHLQT